MLPSEEVVVPMYASSHPVADLMWKAVHDADKDAHADLHTTAKAAIALLGPGVTDLSA